jgi:hypothetical protein
MNANHGTGALFIEDFSKDFNAHIDAPIETRLVKLQEELQQVEDVEAHRRHSGSDSGDVIHSHA